MSLNELAHAAGRPEQWLLFQPYQLGPLRLKNRTILAAMDTGYAEDGGYVSEQMIRYYERRAQGGVGLIHVEFCGVDPSGVGSPHQLRIDDDRFLPGMKRLVDRLHALQVPVMLQLAHSGRQMTTRVAGIAPVAPSAIPCPLLKELPRALETEEVEHLIEQFVRAALRAREAGFDGIQLHGAHGYLVHQFVSPLSNHRTDRFGGTWENRLRFPLEIAGRIRAAMGPDFPIGYKISAEDHFEGGLGLAESTELAQRLEQAGITCLEVSTGTYAQLQHVVQPMLFRRGYLVHFAAHMKRNLRIPVAAVGRINDPELAETILQTGEADLITLGRALLADPDFPAKAKQGRFEDIRRCVACNECMALAFRLEDVACLINPELSREGQVDLRRVPRPRRVLVIGAGPGGIQAALTASEKGHRVMLYDRSGWLGGKMPSVGAPPGKEEYRYYLQYLTTQIAKSTVEVRLNTEVTADLVTELRPDIVIMASGSRPQIPVIPGVDGAHVCTAEQVLYEDSLGPRVVVLGASGTGCETAQYLRGRGHQVTIVARSNKMARSIEPITRQVVIKELKEEGVETAFGLDCVEILPDRIVCRDDAGTRVEFPCDGVVVARGYQAENALAEEIRVRGFPLRLIGDAVKPRKILEAVTEAYLTAASI